MDKEEITKELEFIEHSLGQLIIDLKSLYEIIAELLKIIVPEQAKTFTSDLEQSQINIKAALEYEKICIKKNMKLVAECDNDEEAFKNSKKLLLHSSYRIAMIFECIAKDLYYNKIILLSHEFETYKDEIVENLTHKYKALQETQVSRVQEVNAILEKFKT